MRGAAIFTTTYVAGEASALNAVLGSKAECPPVFYRVGSPASRLDDDGERVRVLRADVNDVRS